MSTCHDVICNGHELSRQNMSEGGLQMSKCVAFCYTGRFIQLRYLDVIKQRSSAKLRTTSIC